MLKILVLHGPNLNLLGQREPSFYGDTCLEELDQQIQNTAKQLQLLALCYQSNAEHILIDYIQTARQKEFNFIIINPAAFTHTSVALRDACCAINLPLIEVHLTNIYAREPFRKTSYFSDIAVGVISGFGILSYELALKAASHYLRSRMEKLHGHQ